VNSAPAGSGTAAAPGGSERPKPRPAEPADSSTQAGEAPTADNSAPADTAPPPRFRPPPPSGPPPDLDDADGDDADGDDGDRSRSPGGGPDISRFLAATEPQPGDDEKDKPPKREGPGFRERHAKAVGRLVRLVVVLAIVAIAATLLRIFVVQPYYIPSESMEPTLHGCQGCNDDHILVEKISYRAHDIRTGDIVVFHRPPGDTSPEDVLIKRVIGIADDTVTLRNGFVYVNGLRTDEPYVNKKCGAHPTVPLTSKSSWKVTAGQVFVLGDNRCNSHDSRAFGPIATSSVIGRAFAIIWPLGRIGFL
jgi:signal peptidase I